LRTDVVRQRVVERCQPVETQGDRLLDPPRRDLRRRPVDGDDAPPEPRVLADLPGAVHGLEVGVRELQAPPELTDLAGEEADLALGHGLEPPALLEERERETTGSVGDDDLGAGATSSRAE
jgi:hypothetical protein